MKITVVAVGRLKAGPERELFERYHGRASAVGRRLGLSFDLAEIPESRAASAEARKDQEGAAILAKASHDGLLIALDQHGTSFGSEAFSERLRSWRNAGTANVAIAIGGADGLGQIVL